MRLLLFPLDSRPCNALLPAQIASIAGHEVIVPPLELLGGPASPAEQAPLLDFLATHAARADAIIASADLCVHGGIEVPRDARTTRQEAAARFLQFSEALRPHGAKTTVFSCIMPRSVTVAREDDVPLQADIAAFNSLRARRLEPDDEVRRRAALARIPGHVLAGYDEARRRHHEVQKRVAGLAVDHKVARVVFVQDESGPHGPHVAEMEELHAVAQGANVTFMPGSDGASALLAAAAVAGEGAWLPRIRVVVSDAPGMGRTPMFEREPLREALHAHLRALGILVDHEHPEMDVFLHPPVSNARDLFLDAEPEAVVDLTEFAAQMYQSIAEERDAVLIDCAHAHGADPHLMDLLPAEALGRLAGFAAWGTASQRVGCALAQVAMSVIGRRSGGYSPGAARRLTRTRLLDDYLFQTIARRELGKRCKSEGIDRFQFGASAAEMDRALQARMRELETEKLHPSPTKVRASFPWRRLFECEIGEAAK